MSWLEQRSEWGVERKKSKALGPTALSEGSRVRVSASSKECVHEEHPRGYERFQFLDSYDVLASDILNEHVMAMSARFEFKTRKKENVARPDLVLIPSKCHTFTGK